MTTALDILEAAVRHQRDRAVTYDSAGGERSAAAAVAAFNAITCRAGDRALSEPEGWLFLQVLKQVRLFRAPGYHADSAEDNVAYGSLLAEAMAQRGAGGVVQPKAAQIDEQSGASVRLRECPCMPGSPCSGPDPGERCQRGYRVPTPSV